MHIIRPLQSAMVESNYSKYIYSGTVLKYEFEVFVLYFSVSHFTLYYSRCIHLRGKYCTLYRTTFIW